MADRKIKIGDIEAELKINMGSILAYEREFVESYTDIFSEVCPPTTRLFKLLFLALAGEVKGLTAERLQGQLTPKELVGISDKLSTVLKEDLGLGETEA